MRLEKTLEVRTLADWPRVERVVEAKAADVRVSPDPLDLGDLADLSHLEVHFQHHYKTSLSYNNSIYQEDLLLKKRLGKTFKSD